MATRLVLQMVAGAWCPLQSCFKSALVLCSRDGTCRLLMHQVTALKLPLSLCHPPQLVRLHSELRERTDEATALHAQLEIAKAEVGKLPQLQERLESLERQLARFGHLHAEREGLQAQLARLLQLEEQTAELQRQLAQREAELATERQASAEGRASASSDGSGSQGEEEECGRQVGGAAASGTSPPLPDMTAANVEAASRQEEAEGQVEQGKAVAGAEAEAHQQQPAYRPWAAADIAAAKPPSSAVLPAAAASERTSAPSSAAAIQLLDFQSTALLAAAAASAAATAHRPAAVSAPERPAASSEVISGLLGVAVAAGAATAAASSKNEECQVVAELDSVRLKLRRAERFLLAYDKVGCCCWRLLLVCCFRPLVLCGSILLADGKIACCCCSR